VRSELVLIVEDNSLNLELMRDILEVHGFEILTAQTGTQGLELALDREPDVVLLDVQLPDLDGLEILRRLRSDRRTAQTPIVAVTAFAMRDDRSRFLDAGFDEYLAKPIDIKTFPQQVRELCRSSCQN
jgi:two-component system cell cycle response regulator DivK